MKNSRKKWTSEDFTKYLLNGKNHGVNLIIYILFNEGNCNKSISLTFCYN